MPKNPSLPRKLRIANRAREVAQVFIAHGLSDLLAHLELPAWLQTGEPQAKGDGETSAAASTPHSPAPAAASPGPLRAASEEPAKVAARPPTSPERLCLAFEELGPTFVKLGQFLSTRDDLVPPAWAKALERLQDSVQEIPFSEIEQQLEVGAHHGGDPHHAAPARSESVSPYRSVQEEPLAAGSIAQVHRAVLRDGRRAVLKILRPGVRQTIEADLDVLSLVASLLEHNQNLGFRPREVLDQFAQDRLEEVDLLHEGRATERLRRLFADDDTVVFPEVFWQATTSRVLALEELDGTPLSRLDFDALDWSVRRQLVQRGARAIVRQCLEFGFFHADPHPGNLMLLDANRIGFVDCGIVGYLSASQRDLLARLVKEVFAGRVEHVQRIATRLADCPAGLEDDHQLQRQLHGLLVDFDQATMESLDITNLLSRLFDILRQHQATIPGDLLKLIKTLTTLETLARRLDPEFSVLRQVTTLTEETLLRHLSAAALRQKALDMVLSYRELLEELPRSARSFLDQLRQRKFELALTHDGLDRLTAALIFASRLLAAALLVASLLVAGSIVLLASRELSWLQPIALLTLASAVGFAAVVVIKHFRYEE